MKKLGKVSAVSAASFLIAGTTAFTAFAAMPAGTVVIGNKAYELNYANDPKNADEITAAVVAAKNAIYVKGFDGAWVNNDAAVTALKDTSVLPAVTYKSAAKTSSFAANDGVEGTTNPTPTVTNGTATASVSMASTKSVAIGQSLVDIGTITLTGTDGNATITGVTVSRSGLSKDAAVKNLTVWDGANKVSMSAILSSGKADIGFLNPVSVPAGQTKTLKVRANIDASNTNAPSGAQLVFTLESLKTADGTTVTGFTPGTTGVITLADMMSSLGTLKLKVSGDAPTGNIDAGNKQVSLAKFTLEPNNEDQLLQSITMTQDGTISDSDITNLKLYNGSTVIGSLDNLSNRKATFSFDKGVSLTKGNYVTLELKADVVSGTGKTINFNIDDQNDVQSQGITYGSVITGTHDLSSDSDDKIMGSTLTINAGSFVISKDPSCVAASTIGTTFKSQNFGSISIQALGEPMQIQKVYVIANNASGYKGTANLQNLKIVANGTTVYSDSNDLQNDAAFTSAAGKEISLNNPVTINPGSPVAFTIYADSKDTASGKYQLGLSNAYGVGTSSGKSTDNSATVAYANPMTVGSVYAEVVQAPQDKLNLFKGSAAAKIATYTIDQNLSEDVSISKVSFNAVSADNVVKGLLNNVKLIDSNGKVISNILTNPTSNSLQFSLNNPITVKPSDNYKFTIVADILSSSDSTPAFTLSFDSNNSKVSTLSNGNSIDFKEKTANDQFAISKGGCSLTALYSLNVKFEDGNTLKTQKDVLVGGYKIANNGDEGAKITKLRLVQDKSLASYTYNSTANSQGTKLTALPAQQFSNIRIVDANDHSKVFGTVGSLATATNVTLSTPIELGDKDSNNNDIDLAILADINDADNGDYLAISLGDPNLNVANNEYIIEAQALQTGTADNVDKVTLPDATTTTVVTPGALNTTASGAKNKKSFVATVPNKIAPSAVSIPNAMGTLATGANPGQVIGEFDLVNTGDAVELDQIGLVDTACAGPRADIVNATLRLIKADDGSVLSDNFKLDGTFNSKGTVGTAYVQIVSGDGKYKRIDANKDIKVQIQVVDSGYVDGSTSTQFLKPGDSVAFKLDKKTTLYSKLGTHAAGYVSNNPLFHVDSNATSATVNITTP